MEVERIKKTIHARMSQVLEQRQKDIMDQLRNEAIRSEMGEESEVEVLAKKIATTPMSEEAERKASTELRKLRQMNSMSSEAVVIRHYLETLCDLPWDKRSVLQTKLAQAQAQLEVTHFGMKTIKQEISKHIAVHNRTKGKQGTVLCLVGPPGVGKTSLGRAIAKATHRQFAHIALGGVKDEAEIRGHRRTYVGSMPGKIIQELSRCGALNPVFMLDEIDKIGQDWRGDPASSLLEVLDPEQNHSFVDHYLEVGFPLNECLFVCTANDVSAIPSALRDRMDVIQLSSYSQEEKVDIARQYLIKKQLQANGLGAKELTISNDALIQLIRRYTREAGVRELDRKIKSLAGQAVLLIDGGQQKSLRIQASTVEKYAGPPLYGAKESLECDRVGLMQGLAWSEYGGSVMSIETVLIPGKGKVISTGRLGKVMEESVSIAFSFLQSQAVELAIDLTVMQTHDMHVHVPEGAIPKDGPSAGVAIFLAMCSTLLKRAIPRTMAVTGEISLTGQVLPIGGVKEKVLAAHRENVGVVLLPEQNKPQWSDIPEPVASQLKVVWLRHAKEAFDTVFRKAGIAAGASAGSSAGSPHTEVKSDKNIDLDNVSLHGFM
jgi:ATP-dependent Lon protease